jgi:hypothetical protein
LARAEVPQFVFFAGLENSGVTRLTPMIDDCASHGFCAVDNWLSVDIGQRAHFFGGDEFVSKMTPALEFVAARHTESKAIFLNGGTGSSLMSYPDGEVYKTNDGGLAVLGPGHLKDLKITEHAVPNLVTIDKSVKAAGGELKVLVVLRKPAQLVASLCRENLWFTCKEAAARQTAAAILMMKQLHSLKPSQIKCLQHEALHDDFWATVPSFLGLNDPAAQDLIEEVSVIDYSEDSEILESVGQLTRITNLLQWLCHRNQ